MRFRHLALSLVLTGLAACATTAPIKPAANLSPEAAVTQRITERWQHIMDKDYKAAYEFMTPGTRAVMPYADYEKRMGQAQIRWMGSTVKQVNCEDAQTCHAEVQLDILVLFPGGGIGQTKTISVVDENWLKSGGQWYFLPSKIR